MQEKNKKNSMFSINLGTSEEQRKQISEALYIALSNSYVLLVKLHNYHWNVTGPTFGPLHTMFQEQYEELFTAIDDIAERIRTLGFKVKATMEHFKATSTIEENNNELKDTEMIADLITAHEVVVTSLRNTAKISTTTDDVETEDLAIERLRIHEKNIWLLMSHLQ